MEMKKEKSRSGAKPLFQDSQPPRMNRSPGKGKSGNGFKLTSNAKYGVDGSQEPVRMGRSVGKSKGGTQWSLSASGPARASRKDTGANSHDGKFYGVGGVSLTNNGGRYGV